jgi:hypothetical protein
MNRFAILSRIGAATTLHGGCDHWDTVWSFVPRTPYGGYAVSRRILEVKDRKMGITIKYGAHSRNQAQSYVYQPKFTIMQIKAVVTGLAYPARVATHSVYAAFDSYDEMADKICSDKLGPKSHYFFEPGEFTKLVFRYSELEQ